MSIWCHEQIYWRIVGCGIDVHCSVQLCGQIYRLIATSAARLAHAPAVLQRTEIGGSV